MIRALRYRCATPRRIVSRSSLAFSFLMDRGYRVSMISPSGRIRCFRCIRRIVTIHRYGIVPLNQPRRLAPCGWCIAPCILSEDTTTGSTTRHRCCNASRAIRVVPWHPAAVRRLRRIHGYDEYWSSTAVSRSVISRSHSRPHSRCSIRAIIFPCSVRTRRSRRIVGGGTAGFFTTTGGGLAAPARPQPARYQPD